MSDSICSKLHCSDRHTGVSRYPVAKPSIKNWIPACACRRRSRLWRRLAGMTATLPSLFTEQKLNNTWKSCTMLMIILIFTLLLPLSQPRAQELIAVMDLVTKNNVSKAFLDSVYTTLSEEITRNTEYIAFDRQFIPFTLEQASSKLSLPCADTTCLTQAGTLLGAKYIIGGSLQLFKRKMEITLNRVDVVTGKPVRTVHRDFTGTTSDFINVTLRKIAQDLMNDNPPEPEPAPIAKEKPSRHILAKLGISALAIAGGGAAVYFYNKNGQTTENGDLPMDDVPGHVR